MKYNFNNNEEKKETKKLSVKEIEKSTLESKTHTKKGVEEAVEIARKIVNSHKGDLKEYFCTRDFETAVRDQISVKFYLEFNDFDCFNEKIVQLLENNEEDVAFAIFFALFTNLRKNKMLYELGINNMTIESFASKYRIYFKADYPIYTFIYLLAKYNVDKTKTGLKKVIDSLEQLLTLPQLSNHAGIINFFSETVCEYYETYLEEIENSEADKEIKKAIDWINKAIKLDGQNNQVGYHKYYLNLGRLYVLCSDFNEGYKYINTAIKYAGEALANDDSLREKTISKYELYIVKASTIQAYHESNNRISELSASKVSNYKTLTLIAGLLGLITGEIQVLENVADPLKLIYLMAFYFGLILFLMTIVLGFIQLSTKEKVKFKSKLFLFGIFIISLVLIIGTFLLIKGI